MIPCQNRQTKQQAKHKNEMKHSRGNTKRNEAPVIVSTGVAFCRLSCLVVVIQVAGLLGVAAFAVGY